jgi:hypothetical protein
MEAAAIASFGCFAVFDLLPGSQHLSAGCIASTILQKAFHAKRRG